MFKNNKKFYQKSGIYIVLEKDLLKKNIGVKIGVKTVDPNCK